MDKTSRGMAPSCLIQLCLLPPEVVEGVLGRPEHSLRWERGCEYKKLPSAAPRPTQEPLLHQVPIKPVKQTSVF